MVPGDEICAGGIRSNPQVHSRILPVSFPRPGVGSAFFALGAHCHSLFLTNIVPKKTQMLPRRLFIVHPWQELQRIRYRHFTQCRRRRTPLPPRRQIPASVGTEVRRLHHPPAWPGCHSAAIPILSQRVIRSRFARWPPAPHHLLSCRSGRSSFAHIPAYHLPAGHCRIRYDHHETLTT